MEGLTNKLEDLNISDSEISSNEPKYHIKECINNLSTKNKRQDKIVIVFSGSDLLWYKSKKSIESDIKPDFIFQKSKSIYFNKKFIKDFYNKILKRKTKLKN